MKVTSLTLCSVSQLSDSVTSCEGQMTHNAMQLGCALKSFNEAGIRLSDNLLLRQHPQLRPSGQEEAHEAVQSSSHRRISRCCASDAGSDVRQPAEL